MGRIIGIMAIMATGLVGCGGTKNIADCEEGRKEIPCSPRTPDEDARLALDEKDYDAAIEILEELVEEEPEEYARYPLLAAAYAGRAGFAILNVTRAQFVEGGTLLGQMQNFLPRKVDLGESKYRESVGDMRSAVQILKGIPASLIAETSSERYAASAALQKTLYQAAYSMMYMNIFAISAATGDFDPAQLENMTTEDAALILANLAEAAKTQGGEQGKILQQKIQEALTDIESQPGETNRERLIEFLKKEQMGDRA